MRLMVNPQSGDHPKGAKWISSRLRSGAYEKLFDFFSPLHSSNPGALRRATFHTVRALHLRDTFFPDDAEQYGE
jgi:hypothetical protein